MPAAFPHPGPPIVFPATTSSATPTGRRLACVQPSDDWLIVAGDVGETFGEIKRALRLLRQRYAKVIWTPVNHELWTQQHDPV